ncbi:MFS transporter [Bacillus toyonensis]|uniref:MFS transporter n=1 Tax=Bacillus toyonensis TaxID=155322 RepID=UPI00253FC303|nr:MFS transporter [Bacillus toyonensis]WIG34039.1 MFS transporter [Bacillus toyonensis]
MAIKKDSILFKMSLLSISLILMIGPAIAAVFPVMKDSFVDQSLASIELIATIPNFGILIFVMIGNVLTSLIGEKKTVMLGLIIALISGLVPVVSDSYLVILVSRFFLGAGVGLINSLAVSLIVQLYDDEEQATMMGLQGAMSAVGSTILTLLVGFLASQGWQASFIVYAIILIPIILFGLFVTLPKKQTVVSKESTSEVTANVKPKLSISMILLAVFAFFIYCFFMNLIVKMSTFVVDSGAGLLESAATAASSITFVSIIIGVIYGKIFKVFKRWVLPIGFFGISFSILLIVNGSSMVFVMLGAILAGIFFSIIAPYLFMMVGEVVPKESNSLAISILLVGINLGVFLSPTIISTLGQVLNLSDAGGNLLVSAIGLGIMGVISVLLVSKVNKKLN